MPPTPRLTPAPQLRLALLLLLPLARVLRALRIAALWLLARARSPPPPLPPPLPLLLLLLLLLVVEEWRAASSADVSAAAQEDSLRKGERVMVEEPGDRGCTGFEDTPGRLAQAAASLPADARLSAAVLPPPPPFLACPGMKKVARPMSLMATWPSWSMRMFAGLRSLCMTPCSCRYCAGGVRKEEGGGGGECECKQGEKCVGVSGCVRGAFGGGGGAV